MNIEERTQLKKMLEEYGIGEAELLYMLLQKVLSPDQKEEILELIDNNDVLKQELEVGDIVVNNQGVRGIILGFDDFHGEKWASVYVNCFPVPQMLPVSDLLFTGKKTDVKNILQNLLKENESEQNS